MSNISIIPTVTKSHDMELAECMDFLAQYGHPRLSQMDDGCWTAAIEVFVSGQGVSFKVTSDYKHRTHREAANVCADRLVATLKQIKEGKK